MRLGWGRSFQFVCLCACVCERGGGARKEVDEGVGGAERIASGLVSIILRKVGYLLV